MDIEQFDQAVKDFRAYADSLANAAKSDIPPVRKVLTDPMPPPDMRSRESAAELGLRKLSQRIEDLMKVHDRLYNSIGMPARYRLFFAAQHLTPLGWEKLQGVLEEMGRRWGQVLQ